MAVPLKSLEQAREEGEVLLKKANCSDAVCLKNLPLEALLEAQMEAMRHFRILHPLLIFYAWSPVVDEQPMDALAKGEAGSIPVMYGTLVNETNLFAGALEPRGLSPVEYFALVTELFPLHVDAVLREYPPSRLGNATLTAAFLMTELLFSCANRLAFSGMTGPVYQYVFSHPMSFAKQWWDGNWLCYNASCHAGELPFCSVPFR